MKAKRAWLAISIVLAIITLCTVIVGAFAGPNLAIQTLVALGALLPALMPEIRDILDRGAGGPDAPKGNRKRILINVAILAAGIALGYLSPRLADAVYPPGPWAGVKVAQSVGLNCRAMLSWRNIPQDSQVWLLVYDPESRFYFPQEHYEQNTNRGSEEIDISVGRESDFGKQFELIPVIAAPAAQKELMEHLLDGSPLIPSGAMRFTSSIVTRKHK
jgi:hypothetical protein